MKNFWDKESIEAIKRLIIPTVEDPNTDKIKTTESIAQKALNEIGLNVNKVDRQGVSPLMKAVSQNKKDLLELLISWGAKLDTIDYTGYTAFDYAYHFSHNQLLEILFETALKTEQGHLIDQFIKKHPNYTHQKPKKYATKKKSKKLFEPQKFTKKETLKSTISPEILIAFKTLKLKPTVNKKLIQKAYHKLALKLHPDSNLEKIPQVKSEAKFIKLTQAYEIALKFLPLKT